jgi:hypothetical protein
VSRAPDKAVVDRHRPFFMLGLQLNETLDGVGFFVSVNYSVVRSAHEDQIGEGVPLGVCLPIVVARSARVGSLDVADLTNHRVPLDQRNRAAGECTAVAGEREQTLNRALAWSLRFTAGCHKTTSPNKLLLGHH